MEIWKFAAFAIVCALLCAVLKQHGVGQGSLLALAGCVASRRLLRAGREEDWRFAAMLAVFGFMLFQMIFEAGNRYFMIYTPFVVLLATAGLQAIFRAAGRRRRA